MAKTPGRPLSGRRHNLDPNRGGTPIGFWGPKYVDAVGRTLDRRDLGRAINWVHQNYRARDVPQEELYHHAWRFPSVQRGLTRWLLVALNSRLKPAEVLLSAPERKRINRALLRYFHVMGVSGEEWVARRARRVYDRAVREAEMELQVPAHKRRRRPGKWKKQGKGVRVLSPQQFAGLQRRLEGKVQGWREELRRKAFDGLVKVIADACGESMAPEAPPVRHLYGTLHYLEDFLLKEVLAFKGEFQRYAKQLRAQKEWLQERVAANQASPEERGQLLVVGNAANSLASLLHGIDFFEEDVKNLQRQHNAEIERIQAEKARRRHPHTH
ncbi:MAG: hypothetical protein J4203_00905 [Candidatus Diapherotrites archaeon]|uniref:Uncharacterized protein n=1 Tax=Candidatus Iainarchaeum sp. TaxID=3101447 RepID=A0A8T4LGN2_9ARCH|nr:hypothetical protein [Candidatus Diapherotrites archaeon]